MRYIQGGNVVSDNASEIIGLIEKMYQIDSFPPFNIAALPILSFFPGWMGRGYLISALMQLC